MWVASNTTTFEGAFLGAFDNRSGAKLDLNCQANSTNVSSWRISHDFYTGLQGSLVFGFAPAQTSRSSLSYTQRMVLSNSGVLFGTSNRAVANFTRYMQIENAGEASISIVRDSANVTGPVLAFGKTRATTSGGSTITQDQDEIGVISFSASNGVNLNGQAASIKAIVSGTPTSTSTPAAILFSTTRVGATATTEAMRITNQQNISIGTASDVAKVVIMNGVTYPSGEAMLYMQTSSPATIPALIAGSSSGTLQIAAGSPLASGGARGGGIDLIGGGASTNAGYVFLRSGTNADGQPSPVVATLTPAGMFGVNTTAPIHRIHAVGATGERIRLLMDTFGEYAGITSRRANGTALAPTKILANDQMSFMNVHGYTGTQYIGSCGSVNLVAEQDWSDTNSPTSIILAPGATGTLGQNNRFIVKSNGNTGVNAMNPVSVFNVTNSSAPSGTGYEVDPDPTNGFVQIRSFDRTAMFYKGIAEAGSQFVWGVGQATGTNVVSMALTTAGNLVITQNNPSSYVNGGGTGNTVIDGQVIIGANSYSSTALCIAAGEKYSGLKIKVGPNTTPNGSADYFDFTTRPGPSGVANNADYTMIRLENSVSKSNPDMYLQPQAAGGRVMIGTATAATNARLTVVAPTGGGSVAQFTGLSTSQSAADLVVSRSGTTLNTSAGMNSSIQLSNGTNGTHVLFQEYNSGLQLFNVIAGNWYERMFMDQGGSFTIGAHSSAAGATAETMQVIGKLAGGNEYCYFAQANTSNMAYAMRIYSATSNSTVGSITFTGSTTSYNTTSDKRMKKNIDIAQSGVDILRSIVVRSFNFKNTDEYVRFGFIAQELYESTPWAVHAGSLDSSDDFDGMTGIWQVDHSKLVPLVVKVQQEIIDELRDTKEQLVQARSEVDQLKNQMAMVLARLQELDGKSST